MRTVPAWKMFMFPVECYRQLERYSMAGALRWLTWGFLGASILLNIVGSTAGAVLFLGLFIGIKVYAFFDLRRTINRLNEQEK